jgi:hypothetical protein
MTPFGFRSLAGGPFEGLAPSSSPRSAAYWSVCALSIWSRECGCRRAAVQGAALGLATSPFVLVLGAGFALPFLLIGVPVRAALVLAGRRTLR